ncbi:hypothetical protein AB0K74_42840 [Streptomyces sp. NPDC056159]|uniref:hypothetical protein n=1 Tax=unclassified Streptomyces TaxID=2593676 RepID=UPI00343E6F3E
MRPHRPVISLGAALRATGAQLTGEQLELAQRPMPQEIGAVLNPDFELADLAWARVYTGARVTRGPAAENDGARAGGPPAPWGRVPSFPLRGFVGHALPG